MRLVKYSPIHPRTRAPASRGRLRKTHTGFPGKLKKLIQEWYNKAI